MLVKNRKDLNISVKSNERHINKGTSYASWQQLETQGTSDALVNDCLCC